MSTRKLVGSVGVDSGQLLIIDPCYIDSAWDNKPPKGKKFHSSSYLEVMEATRSDEGYGPVLTYPNGVTGLGFAFGTTWGDGDYKIYETRDSTGHLLKMEIVLANTEELESNVENQADQECDDEPVTYGNDEDEETGDDWEY